MKQSVRQRIPLVAVGDINGSPLIGRISLYEVCCVEVGPNSDLDAVTLRPASAGGDVIVGVGAPAVGPFENGDFNVVSHAYRVPKAGGQNKSAFILGNTPMVELVLHYERPVALTMKRSVRVHPLGDRDIGGQFTYAVPGAGAFVEAYEVPVYGAKRGTIILRNDGANSYDFKFAMRKYESDSSGAGSYSQEDATAAETLLTNVQRLYHFESEDADTCIVIIKATGAGATTAKLSDRVYDD